MIIYPAIDLRKGRCVRLRHGDPKQETVFSDDPAQVAADWAAAGATWLHVVNLDGAFESRLGGRTSPNIDTLQAILKAVEMSVQFGGGIRSLDDMEMLLEMGVDRLILGTAAVCLGLSSLYFFTSACSAAVSSASRIPRATIVLVMSFLPGPPDFFSRLYNEPRKPENEN